MFIVVIYCTVQAERRDAFLTEVTALRRATRGEPGNIAYGCFEDPINPGQMTFVEEWQSRRDIDEHMAKPYTQAFLAAVVPMLELARSLGVSVRGLSVNVGSQVAEARKQYEQAREEAARAAGEHARFAAQTSPP